MGEYTLIALSERDPLTLKQALSSNDGEGWMEEELDSLLAHQTYDLVDCPPDRKAVGTKWVYRRKRNETGEVVRLKARVVAQGFTQVPGIDFFETHAPVVSIASLRALLSMAATQDWEIHQVDVDLAYLNSDVDQEIYCKQPQGYEVVGKEHQVWKLRKALYGLKQAGNLWYARLKGIMTQMSFKVCRTDPCIFYRFVEKHIIIISTHVDDMGLFANSTNEIKKVKGELSEHVSIKDLGEMKHILGLEISRDRKQRTISISHRTYIDTILERFGFDKSTPVLTPMDTNVRLSKEQSPPNGRRERRDENGPVSISCRLANTCSYNV